MYNTVMYTFYEQNMFVYFLLFCIRSPLKTDSSQSVHSQQTMKSKQTRLKKSITDLLPLTITMGWFDGDDESDQEADTNTAASAVTLKTLKRQIQSLDADPGAEIKDHAAQGDEDEEDPLDAYMKTLEATATVPPTKNNNNSSRNNATESSNKATRLDIDNEEEATDHWKHEPTGSAFMNHHNQDDDNDNDDDGDDPFAPRGESSRAARARQALTSTFHKAGGSKRTADASFLSSQSHATTASQLPESSSTQWSTAVQYQYAPFCKEFWTVTDTSQGREWRKEHSVTCSASIDPVYHFAELTGANGDIGDSDVNANINVNVFGASLTAAIVKAGYQTPTHVQSQTLPVALAGKDALVTAATGQGKTLAYIWPIAVHLADQPALAKGENGPLALVLVPTRELAIQVQKQAKPMLAAVNCTSKVVIGGQGKYILQQELKRSGGVALVVATPGRLLDILSDKKGLSLQRVTFLVLDEADKMLSMGFETQVRDILKQIRRDRQTLLLSATMGRRMEQVAKEWLQPTYVRISVGRTGESSRNVEQHVMVLPNEDAKRAFLLEMLPVFRDVGRTIVFVATREGCETLATRIRAQLPELQVDTLHGDKHQSDRNAALRAFTKGRIVVMIATDVAARGLDVPQVATVLNFDPAKNLDAHVHRVGRAGRLKDNEQQTGSAYTLLTPKNSDFAHVLRSAFEREGRVVSPELLALSQKSRKSGNVVAARNKFNKSGLGFDDRDASHSVETTSTSLASNVTPIASHYGPSPNDGAPQPKRSRWS